ncbi:MAG TPA: DUF2127 domain-containing protein [Labilithrix sp.]|nr:DUF2127 domain-containing protein [Labilithrix sp.]
MAERAGVRFIAGYKLTKGVVQLVLGATLVVLIVSADHALMARIHGSAEYLRRHVTSAWSVRIAMALLRLATPRVVHVAAVALVADGVISLVEGWALRRGHVWAEWLVVIVTGGPLPFEIYELALHPHVGRALLLLFNAAIVFVLLRYRVRARRR